MQPFGASDRAGFFGKKKEAVGPGISDVLSNLNELDRRLKMIEERYSDLNRKTELIDKNRLDERKIVIREIKTIDSDITEIKGEISALKNKVELMIKEFETFARKEDLAALKKYIDLWEPVNFATRNEVEKMIEEALEQNSKS